MDWDHHILSHDDALHVFEVPSHPSISRGLVRTVERGTEHQSRTPPPGADPSAAAATGRERRRRNLDDRVHPRAPQGRGPRDEAAPPFSDPAGRAATSRRARARRPPPTPPPDPQESDARNIFQLTFGAIDVDGSKTVSKAEFLAYYEKARPPGPGAHAPGCSCLALRDRSRRGTPPRTRRAPRAPLHRAA